MADGLSTGIALSGQLKVDDSAQQNLLQAERAAAQERMAQKAALDKEQKAFEDEVRKNTLINSNLKTNFYQKDFSNRANSTMADIIGGIKRGEVTQAQAYAKLQEFKNYTDQIRIADEGLYNGLSAVAKDPAVYDAVGRYDIGGKTYRTFAEALNDPFVRTPEGFEQLKGQFRGTEYEFRQTTPEEKMQGMPDYVVGYSPVEVLDEQDIINEISKVDEVFTSVSSDPSKAFRIPGTREVQMPVSTSIDPSVVPSIVQGYMAQPSAVRGLERAFKMEFIANNPNATDADFYDSKEYTDFLNNASQRLGGKIEALKKTTFKEASIDAPKEAKEAGMKKNYTPARWMSDDGTEVGVELQPKGSATVRNVKLPKGTKIIRGDISIDKPLEKATDAIEAVPVRFIWDKEKKGLEGAYFIYTSDYAPDNTKADAKHTYKVPLNRESLANFTSALKGATQEEVLQVIRETSDQDQLESINKFISGLGIDAGGNPAGVGKDTGAYSNITKVKDASGNVIEMGVKDGKWYNISTGKEIK
jgi:hypothetical protein